MPRKEEIIGKITELVEDYIKGRDLEVYMVDYRKTGPDWKLKVILDKPADSPDEYVNITECEDVARFLGDSLDQLDIIDNKYMLKLSHLEWTENCLRMRILPDSPAEKWKSSFTRPLTV